jgi:CobQ-like glutamine amidotransferase family enzyme
MKTINIIHLYAKEMNIYGDNGNVLILTKRLQRRGYIVSNYHVGVNDKFPSKVNIIVGGGGQDAGQHKIAKDFRNKTTELLSMRDSGVTMLMICGMYQMFGRYFKTSEGKIIEGASLLDLYTEAGNRRVIGNIKTITKYGRLLGFENHSGLTYLQGDTEPLGYTSKNFGNNRKDKTEGAEYKNIFGTYLHGPVLAKAPEFADEIIKRSLITSGFNCDELPPLDDNLALLAGNVAANRPR